MLTSYLGLGAAFGVIVGFWNSIKAFAWRIISVFVQSVSFDEKSNIVVVGYLLDHYYKSPYHDRTISEHTTWLSNSKLATLGLEKYANTNLVFWNGWKPVFYGYSVKKENNNNSTTTTKSFSMTFIRGTLDFDKFIEDAFKYYNSLCWNFNDHQKEEYTRFFIKHIPETGPRNDKNGFNQSHNLPIQYEPSIRLIGYKSSEIGLKPDRRKKSLERLILPNDVKNLIEEIKIWHKHKDWYEEKGIPWKRGWLLHGPPGTGKTALTRAFAEDLDLPIFVYNLAEIGNMEFAEQWRVMHAHTPCIALIEDIDNVFHGRTNVARTNYPQFAMLDDEEDRENEQGNKKKKHSFGRLSFDVFLNALDGVQSTPGIFTIITTNDISKIDEALGKPVDGQFISTRPGRIDKAIHLTYLTLDGKIEMASRILGENTEEFLEIMNYIENNKEQEESPAQFQERCSQIALGSFWKKSETLVRNRLNEKTKSRH